jgi:hypothetical protein
MVALDFFVSLFLQKKNQNWQKMWWEDLAGIEKWSNEEFMRIERRRLKIRGIRRDGCLDFCVLFSFFQQKLEKLADMWLGGVRKTLMELEKWTGR